MNESTVAAMNADATTTLPSEKTGTIPLSLSRVELLASMLDEMGHVLGRQQSDSLGLEYPMLSFGVRPTLVVDHALAALYDQ